MVMTPNSVGQHISNKQTKMREQQTKWTKEKIENKSEGFSVLKTSIMYQVVNMCGLKIG